MIFFPSETIVVVQIGQKLDGKVSYIRKRFDFELLNLGL